MPYFSCVILLLYLGMMAGIILIAIAESNLDRSLLKIKNVKTATLNYIIRE